MISSSLRAIQWLWMLVLVGGLVAGVPGLWSVPPAVAFDEQHDTGHATSKQPPPKPPKPPDKPDPGDDEDPIELITGNFKYEHEDVNITSGRTLLSITRYYNNQDRYDGPLGYAWNMNFHMQVIPVSKGSQHYVIVRDYNGVRYRFSKNADGSYTPPAGWFHQLRDLGQGGMELTKTNGRIYTFDADGDLTNIRSCCTAETFDLLYDNQKRLETVQDSRGGGFAFSYNEHNKISAIADHSGRQASYFYNARLELREYHSPYGMILRYVYDEDHNLTRILNGRGELLLANSYSESHKVVEQTNQRGTFTFTYAAEGENTRVTVKDQDNRSRIHLLNATGQTLQVTDRNGNTEYFTWNEIQRLVSYTNRMGEVFGFEYDDQGRRTRSILPDGRDITVTYDAQGRRSTVTDPAGLTTTFSYDAQGQLTRKTMPSGTRFSAYTYDAEGKLTSLYDAATSAQNPLYTVTHGPEGQISRIDYPNGQHEAFEYNAVGAQTRWDTRGGMQIYYGYTDGGLLDLISYGIGNSFAVYRYRYDPNGNLVETQGPDGNRTRLVVDHFDRLTGVIDPLGNTTQYSYTYDNLTTRTDANGDATEYTYDAVGNVTRVTYPDDTYVEYTYDARSRLTSATESGAGGVAVSFEYDVMDKVTRMACPYLGKTVDYTYDDGGRLTAVAVIDDGSGATHATIQAYTGTDGMDGFVTSAVRRVDGSDIDAPGVAMQYDAAGRTTAVGYPNGIDETRSHNAMGMVDQIRFTQGQTVREQFDYQHGTAGNITQIDRLGLNPATYSYDPLNRLTQAVLPDATILDYGYDLNDNRLSESVGGQQTGYTYDAAGRLLSAGTVTYSYDNNGNRIQKNDGGQITHYDYDYENRLVGISLPGGTVVEYRYYPVLPRAIGKMAALGEQMISLSVNGNEVRFLVGLDLDALMILDDANAVTTWHSGGAKMDDVRVSRSGGADIYHWRDFSGSVIAQADGGANLLGSFAYDPFGSAQGGQPVHFGYTGRNHQPDSGLLYYRARFYDPTVARFLSRDSFVVPTSDPRQLHPYAYVLNNPLLYVDPSGHKHKCPGGAWTGVVTGGEAHFGLGVGLNQIMVVCTARPSVNCIFISFAVSAGLEASASAGVQGIQFLNCPNAGSISGWGGGISGEIAVGGGVDAGASYGIGGCVALAAGGGVGVGGGVSVDFGYTFPKGCNPP